MQDTDMTEHNPSVHQSSATTNVPLKQCSVSRAKSPLNISLSVERPRTEQLSFISDTQRHHLAPKERTVNLGIQRANSTLTTRRDRLTALHRLHAADDGMRKEPAHESTRRKAPGQAEQSSSTHSPINKVGLCPSAALHICLCQPDLKIPRPRNAFILYRQHHHADITAQHAGISNPEISKRAGQLWSAEPDSVKQQWKVLAEEEKLRHSQQFPDYRFQPRHRGKGRADLSVSTSPILCLKCGGQTITAVGGRISVNSAGLQTFDGDARATAVDTAPRALSHLDYLSLQSPKTPQTPSSPSRASALAMHDSNKKRKYQESTLPQVPTHDLRRRTMSDFAGVPDSVQPVPQGYDNLNNSFNTAVARRGSLSSPSAVIHFSRDGRDLGYSPHIMQHRDARLAMAPPPPPAGRFQPSNQGPHEPRSVIRAVDNGNVSPVQDYAALPQTSIHDSSSNTARVSLRLPPVRDHVNHDWSWESLILGMPFAAKIKILRRVVQTVRQQASAQSISNVRPRGVLLAIEGDKDAPVSNVLHLLEERLQTITEFDVRTLNGPNGPDADASLGKYHSEIAAWHQKAAAIIHLLNGNQTSASSAGQTMNDASQREEVRVEARRAGVTTSEACFDSHAEKDGMDIDRPHHAESSSTSIKTKSPESAAGPDNGPQRRPSAASHASSTLSNNPPWPASYASSSSMDEQRTSLNTPDVSRIPVILIPRYLLGASNAWAAALPIRDAYKPADHWQWIATLWRGVPGPDFTIYVRTAEGERLEVEQNRAPSVAAAAAAAASAAATTTTTTWSTGASQGDIREEGGVVLVRCAKDGSLDASAIRRVAFEISEWIRAASDSHFS